MIMYWNVLGWPNPFGPNGMVYNVDPNGFLTRMPVQQLVLTVPGVDLSNPASGDSPVLSTFDFTPTIDGSYEIRHFADVVSGTAGFLIEEPDGTEIFQTPADTTLENGRLSVTENDKTVTIELEGGITYTFQSFAGGGGNIDNYQFEITLI